MALLLRQWLIRVLQYSEPFVSSKDISKGAQWLVTISDQLAETSEGIVCVTPTNVESPWLNYEAGALAKTTGQTAVRTVLLGLSPGDLPAGAPLSNFQHTSAVNVAEMWNLIESIHLRSESAGGDLERVRWAFDQAWPDLESRLEAIVLEQSPEAATNSGSYEQLLIKDVMQEIKSLSIAVAKLSQTSRAGNPLAASADAKIGPLEPAEAAQVSEGMTVRHQVFGEGTVLAIDGSADKKVAAVLFPAGQKRLLLRYAPLSIVGR